MVTDTLCFEIPIRADTGTTAIYLVLTYCIKWIHVYKSSYLGGSTPGTPPRCWMMAAVSSVVKINTWEGENLLWSLCWENITTVFFPLAYSDLTKWIVWAPGAKVSAARGQKKWEVFHCCPKLLLVKATWCWWQWCAAMWVNSDY